MSTTAHEPPSQSPPRARPAWLSVVAVLATAAVGGVILYLARPSVITDDTYAFLTWGRDLRHGVIPPLLEQRTFHPLPILAAAIVTLTGSAAPTVTMLLSLTALMLLAIGAWQVIVECGLAQPAPLLAAALVLINPAMLFLGFTAYINIFFGALVVWGLVFELRASTRAAWAMFVAAALVRPEGWAFLSAYGLLRWWAFGHPLRPGRWLWIALLVAGPPALWIFLEWRLFGDPLYSFHVTTTPAVKATGSGSLSGISSTLHTWVGIPVMIAAVIGIGAIARLAPRDAALRVLGAAAVAAATILVLSRSNFNLPSRQYSVMITLICVLAAAGACAPLAVLARSRGPWAAAAAGLAAGILVVALTVHDTSSRNSTDFHFVRVRYDTSRSLDRAINAVRSRIDTRGARTHSVASFDYTQVSWDLGARADVAAPGSSPGTRLILQPSAASDRELATINRQVHLLSRPPRGWRVIYAEDWTIFAPGGGTTSLGR